MMGARRRPAGGNRSEHKDSSDTSDKSDKSDESGRAEPFRIGLGIFGVGGTGAR